MKKATLLPPSLCCCGEEGDDKSRRRYKNKSTPLPTHTHTLFSMNQLVVMVSMPVCMLVHVHVCVCTRVYIMRRTPAIIYSSVLSASLPYCVLQHALQSLCHMHYWRPTRTLTLMQIATRVIYLGYAHLSPRLILSQAVNNITAGAVFHIDFHCLISHHAPHKLWQKPSFKPVQTSLVGILLQSPLYTLQVPTCGSIPPNGGPVCLEITWVLIYSIRKEANISNRKTPLQSTRSFVRFKCMAFLWIPSDVFFLSWLHNPP